MEKREGRNANTDQRKAKVVMKEVPTKVKKDIVTKNDRRKVVAKMCQEMKRKKLMKVIM